MIFYKLVRNILNLIIKFLNPKKATCPDGIPIKAIKTVSKVIDSHLPNINNKDIKKKIETTSKIADQLAFLTASLKFTEDCYTTA